jgi:hypothetical protein
MRLLIALCLFASCKQVHTTGELDAAVVDAISIDATPVNEDFVVNSDYAGSQFLSNDFEAAGLQLAAVSDNQWIATFRAECVDCDVLARRFDADGVPLHDDLTADTSQFAVNLTKTTSASIPAVAAGPAASSPSGTERVAIVAWDQNGGAMPGVACRGFDQDGNATSSQVMIATDNADVVAANAIGNGNVVVTWQTFISTSVIRSTVVTRECTPLAAPMTVSTASGNFGARRAHVAANDSVVMYTWILDGDVHVRVGNVSGGLFGSDTMLVAKTATEEIDHVRIAPWGPDFVVAARWASINGTGPGKIELYRVSPTGQIITGPHVVTTNSASDFASDKAFGIAVRDDGIVMVAWHACVAGPGSCDVFGRLMRPSGEGVVTVAQVLPTTTAGDQINPSVIAVGNRFVAAWNDNSGTAPDQSGGAVRARIIIPPP